MNSTIKFETVEDMVSYVIKTASFASNYRWKLCEKQNTFYLRRDSGGWDFQRIELSRELGEQLDAIWAHGMRSCYIYIEERKGRLTLPGMLKRLGKTDIGDKIKAQREAIKAEDEKRARNYNRKQIRETSKQLYDLLVGEKSVKNVVADWTDVTDIHFFARLAKLINLLDE